MRPSRQSVTSNNHDTVTFDTTDEQTVRPYRSRIPSDLFSISQGGKKNFLGRIK